MQHYVYADGDIYSGVVDWKSDNLVIVDTDAPGWSFAITQAFGMTPLARDIIEDIKELEDHVYGHPFLDVDLSEHY
jgi:hypothetical protein